jgi:hypothetical protein
MEKENTAKKKQMENGIGMYVMDGYGTGGFQRKRLTNVKN